MSKQATLISKRTKVRRTSDSCRSGGMTAAEFASIASAAGFLEEIARLPHQDVLRLYLLQADQQARELRTLLTAHVEQSEPRAALEAIAGMPVRVRDDMVSAEMRRIALDALNRS